MRWIYLSPHLDDAILSCGGLISHQRNSGISIEIWNLMSGMPPVDAPLSEFASSVQSDWGTVSAKETLELRLAEDRLAAVRVDALPRYFNFLDCIYRHDANGESLYTDAIFAEDNFSQPHHADDVLIAQIGSVLQENLDDDILICPLGIGNHPDHLIVRQAAERTGYPLRYYADIPYSLWYPEQLAELTENLSACGYPISEDEMLAWQEAVAAYASQLTVLFGGEEMMKNAIKNYWSATKSIKLFR